MIYGRYWFRTSDLFRVKEARYHCANRPDGLLTYHRCLPGFKPLVKSLVENFARGMFPRFMPDRGEQGFAE